MPVPAHAQLTFSGVFGSVADPVEEWSWRLRFGTLGTIPPGEPDEVLLPSATAGRQRYATLLAPFFRSDVKLTRTRWSYHDEGGLTTKNGSGQYVQADDFTVVPGEGTGGAPQPLQTAVCVSLDTARSGPTGKGRVFLPQTLFSVGTDYRLAGGDASALASAFRNFLDALEPDVGDARVVSSKGYSSVITRVRVGRVPDTMRSRRRSLDEAYEIAVRA